MPFIFNPLEVAVCGFSNSGKTTLSAALIKEISQEGLSVAYVKHGHQFELDKPGKDSYKAMEAGANQRLLVSGNDHGLISSQKLNDYQAPKYLLDADLVLAEGWKNAPIDKLLVLDDDHKALSLLNKGEFDRVIACAGAGERPDSVDEKIPYFNRNDVELIKQFLLDHLNNKINNRPIYGLLLAGGKSERMGQDKTSLNYHGKSQLEWTTDLIVNHVDKCFISVRGDQDLNSNEQQIKDKFIGFGPMGGILSAMKEHPHASWLVAACDLPYLESQTTELLLANRNPWKYATAFESSHDGFPEPLFAIYEPKAVFQLLYFLGLGYHCPRKVLINSEIQTIIQKNERWLDNVNLPEEYEQAKKDFKQ